MGIPLVGIPLVPQCEPPRPFRGGAVILCQRTIVIIVRISMISGARVRRKIAAIFSVVV